MADAVVSAGLDALVRRSNPEFVDQCRSKSKNAAAVYGQMAIRRGGFRTRDRT